jgi:hypothetical protein
LDSGASITSFDSNLWLGKIIPSSDHIGHNSLTKIVEISHDGGISHLQPVTQYDYSIANLVNILQTVADDNYGTPLGFEFFN